MVAQSRSRRQEGASSSVVSGGRFHRITKTCKYVTEGGRRRTRRRRWNYIWIPRNALPFARRRCHHSASLGWRYGPAPHLSLSLPVCHRNRLKQKIYLSLWTQQTEYYAPEENELAFNLLIYWPSAFPMDVVAATSTDGALIGVPPLHSSPPCLSTTESRELKLIGPATDCDCGNAIIIMFQLVSGWSVRVPFVAEAADAGERPTRRSFDNNLTHNQEW